MTVIEDPIAPTATNRISTSELCERSGATPRQVKYWVQLGIIEPSATRPGRGVVAEEFEWVMPMVPLVRCLGQLAASGAGADQLRAVALVLKDATPRNWGGKLYISPSGKVSVKMIGPVSLVLNLDHTAAERLAVSATAVVS